jgi:hypothetical protein
MTNLSCANCKMIIIGATCVGVDLLPICFDCWIASKVSTDGKITCPKCYGIGKIKQYFKLNDHPCIVCQGQGRITKANIEKIVMPVSLSKTAELDFDECPF